MAFWQDLFEGKPTTHTQLSLLNPEQEKYRSNILGQAQRGLNQSFDFTPIATAAQNRFQQQTLPSISERFANFNAQRGSGFNQATANAQRDLQTDLAAQQAQYGQQSMRTWADLLGQGLRPTSENITEEGTEPGINNIIESILPLLIHGGAAYATGGASIPFSAAMYGGGGGDYSELMKWFSNMRGKNKQSDNKQNNNQPQTTGSTKSSNLAGSPAAILGGGGGGGFGW